MRVLAFSDLHCDLAAAQALVEAAKGADLVVGAGDFASFHRGLEAVMDIFEQVKDKAVFVPGNHESAEELRVATGAVVLHGQVAEFGGLQVAGIGYAVPSQGSSDWSCDLSEAEVEAMLAPVERADILISHSPPEGVADRTRDGDAAGSVALRRAVERMSPQLVSCGHIHDAWGQSGQIGGNRVHNLGPQINWFEVST